MRDEIIKLENVNYQYKGANETSLNDVSLSIKKGEVILLCGASGSGKTSLIRLLNGLIPHYYQGDLTGKVTVSGLDITKTELYELAGIVGTVFQNPRSQFFSVDTDGEIVFGLENIGLEPEEIKRRKDLIINQMNIQKLLGKSLFELSGGEKQQIACASVAALLPEIILLDEPSSNLDYIAMERLRTIIHDWKTQGKTIIISEHRLWYLQNLFDRVLYMDEGIIKKEWTEEEFTNLKEEEIQSLKLRPITLKQRFMESLGNQAEVCAEKNNCILLKNFFFSYNKKPYFFRKEKFTSKSSCLHLSIPTLSLPKGKVIALIGNNGMGKSTLLRCICGLEKDCTGSIHYDGKEYKGKKRTHVSFLVMQDVNHQLFADSVENEVLLSMNKKDIKRCHEILDSLGILECKDKHPMSLSGGQKQRVAIASAIAASAKILLFDEPTSGLDYEHMYKVSLLLRELADNGSTILVSTHDSELIDQCCDYKLCMNEGTVLFFEQI